MRMNVSGDENYDRGREKDKHTKIKEETTAEKEKKEKKIKKKQKKKTGKIKDKVSNMMREPLRQTGESGSTKRL